jgi:hypothetical protein
VPPILEALGRSARPEVDAHDVFHGARDLVIRERRAAPGRGPAQQQDRNGRGVYGMKALGSGQVTGKAAVALALRYAFRYPHAHSICLGITSDAELETAVASWRHAGDRATGSPS